MKTNQIDYQVSASDNRIKEILNASDQSYQELEEIPTQDRLTYSNGFYINHITAVFIDIRGSSKLSSSHTRPVLGKLYRAYISECIAILNQDANCRQIFINGDCVAGIFHTKSGSSVDEAFFRAGQLNTLINILNWRLTEKGYTPIQCGIGIDYGRALMLQAGFSGSGINEIIWMGDVVNNASNLCHQGNKNGNLSIQVSQDIYSKLTRRDYKSLIEPVRSGGLVPKIQYQCDVVSVEMDEWFLMEKNKSPKKQAISAGLPGLIQAAQSRGTLLNALASISGLGRSGISSPFLSGAKFLYPDGK